MVCRAYQTETREEARGVLPAAADLGDAAVLQLCVVFDQRTFQRQLDDILLALESKVGVRLAPAIGAGMRVRIKAGPLQGIEGWVEERYGMTIVLLRLDFINRAAAVKIDADALELI